MSADKPAAIHSYLTNAFPRRFIEQRHDWERDAQSFKVHLERGTLLLKVSDEFINDHTPEDIASLLERWVWRLSSPKAVTPESLWQRAGPLFSAELDTRGFCNADSVH